jgi:hypothetical protein
MIGAPLVDRYHISILLTVYAASPSRIWYVTIVSFVCRDPAYPGILLTDFFSIQI